MAAADAQMLWLSATVPNDQFLLYGFGGTPDDPGEALTRLRSNAATCPDLGLRGVDDDRWRYPRWEPAEITEEQFVVHPAGEWQHCVQTVATLPALDTARMCWRAHVFPGLTGIPASACPVGSVVVVQIAHALADGVRSAALAAALLGRRSLPPPVPAPERGMLVWRAVIAAREHRRLQRDVAAGRIDPPGSPRPALSINDGPRRAVTARTLVVRRAELPGPTVTVGALVAIGEALGGYLAARGEDISRLGAEVPIAGSGHRLARNDFRNVGVDLRPKIAADERAVLLARQLAGHRRRSAHPAMRASAEAFAGVPAALLRWGVSRFDPMARSATVAGHTVVSSVNRGPADLSFGGHRVILTAGYPALSPMMALTHGVHGIGDTVAISVHADPTAVDVEDYLDRLSHALGRRV